MFNLRARDLRSYIIPYIPYKHTRVRHPFCNAIHFTLHRPRRTLPEPRLRRITSHLSFNRSEGWSDKTTRFPDMFDRTFKLDAFVISTFARFTRDTHTHSVPFPVLCTCMYMHTKRVHTLSKR